MKLQYLKKLNLPDASGVYTFRDNKKRPLYIGRATSLKDRVRSYFSADLIETRGPRIIDMVTKADSLTWQETGSVLEAIILENTLIKRYQPRYNVDERDDKSSQYVIITDEPWPRVFLVRARDFDLTRHSKSVLSSDLPYKAMKYFGPYTESGLIKEALKILRKLFPFRDKKSYDSRHERFYRAIGKSPERFVKSTTTKNNNSDINNGNEKIVDEENARQNYLRTIKYLILFFEGKKKRLRESIKKEMNLVAKEMRFEDANQLKKTLFAIDHVNDIALLKEKEHKNQVPTFQDSIETTKTTVRIEAYDIAHLSGTNVVGAMAVSVNREAEPSEYRRFKLKHQANNDAACLAEILSRRLNHSEWEYPDIIVVDGNQIQVNATEDVLKARRINISVVGVIKDKRHRAFSIVGNSELIQRYKKEIIATNAEAHRFAIKYHRNLRNSVSLYTFYNK